MLSKKEIRSQIKEKRNLLLSGNREKLDKIIYERLIESYEYINAETIFIFVSYNNEVDTYNIIKKALADNKKLCVPKIISKEEGMISVQIKSLGDLEVGNYNIWEPKDISLKIDERCIDLVYVPGLAFDKDGGRLGYGGGFYDRFLSKVRKDCKKIGLAYSFQVLDKIPMEEQDIFIDGIITD